MNGPEAIITSQFHASSLFEDLHIITQNIPVDIILYLVSLFSILNLDIISQNIPVDILLHYLGKEDIQRKNYVDLILRITQ
jgi:hypothetical protein